MQNKPNANTAFLLFILGACMVTNILFLTVEPSKQKNKHKGIEGNTSVKELGTFCGNKAH
jgi:hypothetical protein